MVLTQHFLILILAAKTWRYLLKYGRGVYCFVVIFFLLIGVILCVSPGILHFRVRTTLQHRLLSKGFVICQSPDGLDISASVLSSLDGFAGDSPFETLLALNYCLTQAYNLINCHLSNAWSRLFPYRYLIVHLSPSLFLHPKQEVRTFIFIFRVSSSRRSAL